MSKRLAAGMSCMCARERTADSMAIELIFDADCPNVDHARSNLAAALNAVGREPRWIEWKRSAADSPPYVRGYGSPTVLVGGEDVSGQLAGDGGSCCRVYRSGANRFVGAPPVEQIVAALEGHAAHPAKGPPPASGWKSSLATLPAVVAALLPAGLCPACWPAYAGLLSAVGLGFLLDTAYLLPLTAVLLAVAVAALAVRAPTRRGYAPFLLGLAASAVVLIGKFVFESNAAMYGGLIMLVTASIWNAWPVRQKNAACPSSARVRT